MSGRACQGFMDVVDPKVLADGPDGRAKVEAYEALLDKGSENWTADDYEVVRGLMENYNESAPKRARIHSGKETFLKEHMPTPLALLVQWEALPAGVHDVFGGNNSDAFAKFAANSKAMTAMLLKKWESLSEQEKSVYEGLTL